MTSVERQDKMEINIIIRSLGHHRARMQRELMHYLEVTVMVKDIMMKRIILIIIIIIIIIIAASAIAPIIHFQLTVGATCDLKPRQRLVLFASSVLFLLLLIMLLQLFLHLSSFPSSLLLRVSFSCSEGTS